MRKQQRSWLSLLTFCAVTVLIVALGSAVLLAGASVAFAVADPSPGVDGNGNNEVVLPDGAKPAAAQPIDENGYAASRIFAGMITDSRCGARHRMNSGKTSAECVRSCVRNGAHYVLVDGEQVYVLTGNQSPLKKVAGERAKVLGILEGDTIRVKDIVTETAH